MTAPVSHLVPERLHTERLLLRRPIEGDGTALYGAIQASIQELKPWMTWASELLSEDSYHENLRRASARFDDRQELRYLIFDKHTDMLIGSTGFHALDWRVPKAEIGYWVDTRYARRGFITEAVKALTTFGFEELGFRRIEVRCDALNAQSVAVAKRSGYELNATLINDDIAVDDPKQLRDTLLFSLTR